MQMIRHQDIIAHEPSGSLIFPDLMQRLLYAGLRQPRRPLFRADSQKNPIMAAQHDMDPFGWRAAPWFKKLSIGHWLNL
jgi:hypothetical protein